MLLKKWSDILTIVNGKNQKDVVSPDGQYPIYGSGGVIGYATSYLCEAGTTIIGRKGTINNPIFVDKKFWNVDTAFGISPGKELIPKFLYYFCCSFNFTELDKSTTIPSLAKRDLLQIKMPVPSIEEQERIVSKIEELFSRLDASVTELQTAKEKLKVYRQAVLKEAFGGKFTNHQNVDINLRWASPEETATLPAIPREWKYVSLSELGNLGRGKSKHRPRNDSILFENGTYPFIQTGDVKAAKHYITTYSKKYNKVGLEQSKLWPKGTLCITIAANIAETAFLGIDACFPDSIVGFTPFGYILPQYVKYFIESEKIRLWAFAPATAQKNINLDTLEKLIVPYCSLTEQQAVISEIEIRTTICDNIEKNIDNALQEANALRQSILKQAFEGE